MWVNLTAFPSYAYGVVCRPFQFTVHSCHSWHQVALAIVAARSSTSSGDAGGGGFGPVDPPGSLPHAVTIDALMSTLVDLQAVAMQHNNTRWVSAAVCSLQLLAVHVHADTVRRGGQNSDLMRNKCLCCVEVLRMCRPLSECLRVDVRRECYSLFLLSRSMMFGANASVDYIASRVATSTSFTAYIQPFVVNQVAAPVE